MTVSVVVPAFNAEPYLERSITSIKNQTLPPNEIIVINDGSTDHTYEVALGLGVGHIVNHPTNKGIGESRQRGAKEANSDYVAFLSADDCWHTRFLETLTKYANGKNIVFSDYYCCDNQLIPQTVFHAPHFNSQKQFRQLAIDWALQKNMFTNFSACLFPRWLFNQIQFRPNLKHGEDLVFLLETMLHHVEWRHVDEPLVYYRASKYQQNFPEWSLLWEQIIPLLVKLGVDEVDCYLAQIKNRNVIFPTVEMRVYRRLRKIARNYIINLKMLVRK